MLTQTLVALATATIIAQSTTAPPPISSNMPVPIHAEIKVETPLEPTKSKPVKRPFSERHPKVYGVVHKMRIFCEEVQPIIGVGGSIAQCLYLFHL